MRAHYIFCSPGPGLTYSMVTKGSKEREIFGRQYISVYLPVYLRAVYLSISLRAVYFSSISQYISEQYISVVYISISQSSIFHQYISVYLRAVYLSSISQYISAVYLTISVNIFESRISQQYISLSHSYQ